MKISFFNNAFDKEPDLVDSRWPPFDHHSVTESKEMTLAFCPAEYKEGTTRAKKNVESVHFAVVDLDHKPVSEVERVLDLLDGYEIALYSSWSHLKGGEDDCCLRILMPVSRPILRDEWRDFWRALDDEVDNLADPACKDPSRIYFIPAVSAEYDQANLTCEFFDGVPIDVDAFLSRAPKKVVNTRAQSHGTTTKEDLETLANILVRRSSSTTKRASKAIKQALKGLAYADPGERDNVLLYTAGELAQAYPDEDPDHLASFFERSIETTNERDGDGPDLANFTDKILRKQEEVEEQRAELAAVAEAVREVRRERAFKTIGVDRKDQYDDDDLDDMECAPDEWIIQKGDTYYFRVFDRYSRGYTFNEAQVQASILLSPARHIKTEGFNRMGDMVEVSLRDLVKEHGKVVDRVAFDITSPISYLESSVLYEAPCPFLCGPEENPEIQRWLEALGGEHTPQLIEWLGYSMELEYPLTALYLSGTKNSGKSLLANGLAQIWTTGGPTPMQSVLNSFNSSVAKCPLVFGDEKLPENLSSDRLRQLIQDRSTQINAKFKEEVPMRGSLRYILAANNKKLLRPADDMTRNDIEALAERFFHLNITQKASDVLDKVGHARIQDEWIDNQGIAKHAMWLRTQLQDPAEKPSRFLVTGGDNGLVDFLMVHSGARSAICQWLFNHLKDPQRVRSVGKLGVTNGVYTLDVQTLYNSWDTYHKRERLPGISRLSSLLEGIAESKLDKNGEHYHEVDLDLLALWADTTGVSTRQRVYQLVEEYEHSRKAGKRG